MGAHCGGAGAELVLLLPAKGVDASTPTTDQPAPESVVRCTFGAADAAMLGGQPRWKQHRSSHNRTACMCGACRVAWAGPQHN